MLGHVKSCRSLGHAVAVGRCRSDQRGAENQDEKNSCGRGQGLCRGRHCKQKAVRFQQNSCMKLLDIGVRSCKVSASQFIGRFRGKPLTEKIKTMTIQSRSSRA